MGNNNNGKSREADDDGCARVIWCVAAIFFALAFFEIPALLRMDGSAPEE